MLQVLFSGLPTKFLPLGDGGTLGVLGDSLARHGLIKPPFYSRNL